MKVEEFLFVLLEEVFFVVEDDIVLFVVIEMEMLWYFEWFDELLGVCELICLVECVWELLVLLVWLLFDWEVLFERKDNCFSFEV